MLAAHLLGRNHVLQRAKAQGVEIRPDEAEEFAEDIPRTIPKEAIAFFKNRIRLPMKTIEKLVAQLQGKSAAAVKALLDHLRGAIDGELLTALRAGTGIKAFIENVQAMLVRNGLGAANPFRLETIFRTNLNQAYTAGRLAQIEHPDVAPVFQWLQYNAIMDSRVRPEHAAMNGKVFRRDDPIWKTWTPPNGFNSFAPDTLVAGQVKSASKAWYSGPMVKIQTARGARLSVTINHPVLTPRGYVAAGDLAEGDDLVAHGPSLESLVSGSGDDALAAPLVSGRAVDDEHGPSRIEDVFESFATQGIGTTIPRAGTMDFHGDSEFMYGDVDVVWPHCVLADHVEPSALKGSNDVSFVPDVALASAALATRSMLSAGRFVGLGVAAYLYAPALEPLDDGLARGSHALAQLVGGYASEVLTDQVIDIQVVPYTGHVYDLQSPNGWIVAQGIFASNCRCSLTPVSKLDLEDEGLAVSTAAPKIDGNAVRPDKGFRFNAAEKLRKAVQG